MPSGFIYPKSSTIQDLAKCLLWKVSLLTWVLFDTMSHNLAWDEDLKKIDGKALTLGDVQTFCLLVATFFDWPDRQDDFLVEGWRW